MLIASKLTSQNISYYKFSMKKCLLKEVQAMNRTLLKIVSASVLILASVMSFSAMAGDAVAGKSKAALCVACHGADGISPSPDIPNLAGQKEVYLAKAIRDYKSGARKNPMMASVVGMIADDDIADIAAYFSSLQ